NASEAITGRDGIITVRTAIEGQYVVLEVTDTGCGMDADAQARLFDPFFTTKPAGHGLGLAVVRQIVRGINGVIRFETQLGRGTAFRVLLPSLAGAVAPRPLPAPRLSGKWQGAGSVLIVEDEAPLRVAVARLLRKKDVPVLE